MKQPPITFSVEPYIADGRPQWAVVRHSPRWVPGPFWRGGEYVDDTFLECVVDTREQAEELMEHKKRSDQEDVA